MNILHKYTAYHSTWLRWCGRGSPTLGKDASVSLVGDQQYKIQYQVHQYPTMGLLSILCIVPSHPTFKRLPSTAPQGERASDHLRCPTVYSPPQPHASPPQQAHQV